MTIELTEIQKKLLAISKPRSKEAIKRAKKRKEKRKRKGRTTMTQEDKNLLLKDLCARLPYGVMIQIPELFYPQRKVIEKLVTIDDLWHFNDSGIYIENVKPYLRPMLSMTKEEYEELRKIDKYYGIAPLSEINDWEPGYKSIDWLNSHHFDYRGLIPKNLAIEVTKENNPYK